MSLFGGGGNGPVADLVKMKSGQGRCCNRVSALSGGQVVENRLRDW